MWTPELLRCPTALMLSVALAVTLATGVAWGSDGAARNALIVDAMAGPMAASSIAFWEPRPYEQDAPGVNALLQQRAVLLVLLAVSSILLAGIALEFVRRRLAPRFSSQERQALASHRDLISRYANDAIILVDDSGRIVQANDRAAEYYGYRLEELVQMHVRDLRAPSHTDNFERQWVLAGAPGGLVFETIHRRRNGELFPVEVSTRPFTLGGVTFRQSIVRDISERKRAEEALRESEDRFRQVVENAPYAIYVNTGECFRYLNPAAVRMYGASSPDQLIGQPVLDRVHPDYLEQARERSALLLSGHQNLPVMDQKWFRLDGTVFDVEVSAVPFVFRHQRGGLVFFHDVTERKRLEEQFRQAQKMESVGRLAGGVAHDFNNLLTVINGYADLLVADLDRHDPLWSRVDEIRKAGERAASLTKQLLAFSRKQVVEPKTLDLNTVIRDAERMLRRIIGEDIALVTSLDPSLGQVLADPEQVHQVMMNLVVNARDAMPDGGRLEIATVNIEIGDSDSPLHPDARPGCFVLMTVTDNGTGMSEKTRQRIFEPFFTTKEQDKGTGLGLSTVYGIVRQSGGWIDVSSELGAGTSFKLYFPRIDGGAVEEEGEATRTQAPQEGETILVIEDQDAVRQLTKTILTAAGYRVLDGANGDEAIDIAQKYPARIDLLLTDVVLPGINGKELSERLRAVRPELKVLFMSGYTADVLGQRGVLDSRVAYISKPFSPDKLTAKVREVLTGPLPS